MYQLFTKIILFNNYNKFKTIEYKSPNIIQSTLHLERTLSAYTMPI